MILFNNFKRQYQGIKRDINSALERVLENGWYILGKEVEDFEKNFSRYIGTKYCIGVASGTDAITISLKALDIGIGDEVITTNITAFPTITGILNANARPVVIDVNEKDVLINPDLIESAITEHTKAIIPVHLYGQSCDMDKITAIAERHNLLVIEDCAQSTGTIYKDKKTGSFGCMASFSFYPTKNLGAYGDGGAITTNSKHFAERIRRIRNYGQRDRYYHVEHGMNSRLDEIQAAILNVKLKFLEKSLEKRHEIATFYRNKIKPELLLIENNYGLCSYHLFVIRHQNRDKFRKHLMDNGVQTLIHYPVPVNRQQAYYFQKDQSFPCSDLLCSSVLSLPLYPELEQKEINKVMEVINNYKD